MKQVTVAAAGMYETSVHVIYLRSTAVTWFKIQARVEHISTGAYKALAFAIPQEIDSLNRSSERLEDLARSDDEATRSSVRLASALARSILMRGDSVEGLEIRHPD